MADFPPNHPLYGITVTKDEINHIISTALPGSKIISSAEFPSDTSFNNKLYDVVVSGDPGDDEKHLILRFCGRFWKHRKTLNEVACLKLLEHTSIPTPKVMAYSADGEKEWILMEKLPGVSLSSLSLSEDDEIKIAKQLARILYTMRKDLKRADGLIGNLSSYDSDIGIVKFGPHIDAPSATGWPWKHYLDYTRAMLEDACHSLENTPTLAPNRFLLQKIQEFIDKKLSNLGVFSDETFCQSVFTHGDFSAKNILIDPDNMAILGIVDFEWSGFFPFDVEFANSEGEAFENDEEGCMNKLLLEEMKKLGLEINRTVNEELRKQAVDLTSLRTNIAPWWLIVLDESDEKLPSELREAAEKVDEILHRLS